MRKGDIVTLIGVKGKIVRMLFWADGTKLVRLKDKSSKLFDRIIAPELMAIK